MRRLGTTAIATLVTLIVGRADAQFSRPPTQPILAADPAAQIAALQQQVAALQAAVQTLQGTVRTLSGTVQTLQGKTQFVTSDGVNYNLNIPGNLFIDVGGPGQNSNVVIKAKNTVDIRAGMIASLWSTATAVVRGDDGMAILGRSVRINTNDTNGHPAAYVGSAGPTSVGAGSGLTGSASVTIGP